MYSIIRSSLRLTASQPPRHHGGPLAGAEAAVHGADVGRDQQRAVGVAVRQAAAPASPCPPRAGLPARSPTGSLLQRRGHRLQPDRVVGIVGVDQGEVVRRDGELVLGLQGADGFQLLRGEGEQVAELADGADGVLRLPAPVVPLVVGDVAPERVAPRLTGRFFVLDAGVARAGIGTESSPVRSSDSLIVRSLQLRLGYPGCQRSADDSSCEQTCAVKKTRPL